jgi:hypothetical protein
MLRISAQQLSNVLGDLIAFNDTARILTDTTTNTKYGHFLWISPGFYSNVGFNQTTTLISETVFYKKYQNGGCFSFSYFINGNYPGKLNFYIKPYGMDKILSKSIEGNQGNSWRRATFDIEPQTVNFEIYIDVTLDIAVGNIAIDDLLLFDHSCDNVDTTPSPDNLFNCDDLNGTVVSYAKVCNFIQGIFNFEKC